MTVMNSRCGTDALDIFKTAVAAVEPVQAVRAHFSYDEKTQTLRIDDHSLTLAESARVFVIGAGKAAGPMAAAVEAMLGKRVHDGIVVTKYQHHAKLNTITLREAGHPVPDANGLAASQAIIDLLTQTRADDVVICLISGGGSALLPAPVDGVSLDDKMTLTQQLLGCGASIDEINTVRKHLSRLKGGGLARLAAPARLVNLILSDVVGDPLDAIASGPTVADTTTFADALTILDQYRISDQVPASVISHLQQGVNGQVAETPKPGDAIFANTYNILVGNNRMAVEAAKTRAQTLGYQTHVVTTTLSGETRHAAAKLIDHARQVHHTKTPVSTPACLIAGGETTVTLGAQHGKGGRNQEFALAAALLIEDLPGVCILSAGTDGTDGPTDAAGAVADAYTARRARDAGLDAAATLAQHDAYTLFQTLGDLIITGPTNTNVMDLNIILIDNAGDG